MEVKTPCFSYSTSSPSSSPSSTKLKLPVVVGGEITILPSNPNPMIRYRECQRNHAAHLGSHVIDGCGEFMPASADDNTPLSLKCAACNCHRNFHRREVEGQPTTVPPPLILPPPPALPPTTANCFISFSSPKPAQNQKQPTVRTHVGPTHRPPPVMVAFGGAESSSEDLNRVGVGLKKRFRTKFTQEQKEKMLEFAEKIGWRMQKQDEDEMLRFCNQVGVKRRVFKVWLHNNKQAMKRKETQPPPAPPQQQPP